MSVIVTNNKSVQKPAPKKEKKAENKKDTKK